MSQIIKNLVSGGPVPPEIATSYVTQDGTAVPAANVLIVNAIDSTENNANGIITKGGVLGTGTSNEVDVVITNRLQGTAVSTNASNADIITFSLGASAAVYRFSFDVTARDTGTGDGLGYTVFASARTTGAAATVIATPFTDSDEDASLLAATISFISSGNTVILRAVGVAGQTINYTAVGTYVVA